MIVFGLCKLVIPPNRRRPFIIITAPKRTISVPMMLWRSLNLWSLMYEDPSPSAKSTGIVPRAKSAIASPPCQKLPVLIAISCIESVNPQGKKKVSIPMMGANAGFLLFMVVFDQLFGRWNPRLLIFGKRLSKWSPIQRTMIPTMIVRILVMVSDNAIAFPRIPSIPQRRKNPPILPAWKASWVLRWFLVPVCWSP